MNSMVGAVSLGVVDGEVLVDLDYREDSRAGTDMNVVMDGNAGLLEVQGTAEREPYSREELNSMLDLAGEAIDKLIGLQKKVLEI
jgi:ribonuclease PH